MGTNNFELVTMTLEFDLLYENVNLVNNFSAVRARSLVFYRNIPSGISECTNISDPVTMTFDLFFLTFNLCKVLLNSKC